MKAPTIVILAGDPDRSIARQRVDSLMADWSSAPPPRIELQTPIELIEESTACDLIVCASADLPDNKRLLRCLNDHLDDREIPIVVLTSDSDESAIAMTADLCIAMNESDEAIRRFVATLLQRQRVILRLQAELGLAQRFQGGLRGEIVKMHEELQLAAMVQREFLPQSVPTLHGVQFSALWRPAHYVSGDIYDVTRLDEDHVGVFLADAVGHGVPAALMTMVIARSLPTKEVKGNQYRLVPPGEAMQRLNTEMIRRQGETTRFATAVYAVCNCRDRTVRIAGAGHPPPFHLRADGSLEQIPSAGSLLGVFPDEEFPETQVELALNETVLFYSDGFEVAFQSDESADCRLPTREYIDEFDRLRELPGSALMVNEIAKRLNTQPGSLHQSDDLTLICAFAGPMDAPDGVRPEPNVDTRSQLLARP